MMQIDYRKQFLKLKAIVALTKGLTIEASAQDILYSGKFTFLLSTQLIKPSHCLYVYCLLYIF